MCWATRIGHGKSAGSGVSRASSAGGPPVEVPTSTSPSPWRARAGACSAGVGRGSPERPGAAADAVPDALPQPRARPDLGAGRGADLVDQLGAPARRYAARPRPSGLATKSTAPSAAPRSVASAPSAVSDETMTTGQGRSTMMRSRQASPSICGMWMSSVTTSGLKTSSSVQRLQPVAGELDLEVRLGRENLAQQLAHQRGVVDDQDLDHERRPSSWRLAWNASSSPRSARVSSSAGSSSSTMRPAFSRLITPLTRRTASSVRSGAGSIASARAAQHLRHAVDDQAGAMALGAHHDQAARALSARAPACRSGGAGRPPAALRRAD